MTKNKKKKQPVIPQRRKNEELRAVLEKYFPGALQAKNGGYVVNSAMLQDAISPEHGKVVDEGFELRWVGKKEAYHHAYTPNDKILKPLRADSADFDSTRNILIKGDNLDALKLLRLNYFERVKVIYIDPPYNTASDEFVYNDNYTKSQEKVLDELGYSPEQKEFVKNINGDATHSGWLNFMYPRLLLARDLLADDGVIFISIDDNEQANLKLLCDEIFGEINFISGLVVKSNPGGRDYGGIALTHDNILAYAKSDHTTLNQISSENGALPYRDSHGNFSMRELRNRNVRFNKQNRPNLYYPFYVKPGAPDENGLHTLSLSPRKGWVEVYPLESQGIQTIWRWGKEKASAALNVDVMGRRKRDGDFMIIEKYRSNMQRERSILDKTEYRNEQGTLAIRSLFPDCAVFNYPKSDRLIKRIIELGGNQNAIVLDFFAGSATTGDAVMQLNAEDGGKRQFILVQLAENINPEKNKTPHDFVKKELGKEPTIFEIAAERLRRAGVKVREEWENTNGNLAGGAEPPDVGFRVFEIAEDAGNEMYQRPLAEIKHGDVAALPLDSPHDDDTILYNMMLGEGVPLDSEVQEHVKGALYQVGEVLFVLNEFDLMKHHHLISTRRICVYGARIANNKFILELEGNFSENIVVKGKIR